MAQLTGTTQRIRGRQRLGTKTTSPSCMTQQPAAGANSWENRSKKLHTRRSLARTASHHSSNNYRVQGVTTSASQTKLPCELRCDHHRPQHVGYMSMGPRNPSEPPMPPPSSRSVITHKSYIPDCLSFPNHRVSL